MHRLAMPWAPRAVMAVMATLIGSGSAQSGPLGGPLGGVLKDKFGIDVGHYSSTADGRMKVFVWMQGDPVAVVLGPEVDEEFAVADPTRIVVAFGINPRPLVYTSTDCSGQAYLFDDGLGSETGVARATTIGNGRGEGVSFVSVGAPRATLRLGSIRDHRTTGTEPTQCYPWNNDGTVYPVTKVVDFAQKYRPPYRIRAE